jgi:hypothetical protein
MKFCHYIRVLIVIFGLICFSSQLHAASKKVPTSTINKLYQQVLVNGVTEEGRAEIKDGPAVDFIKVKPVDLNGDGNPEYIVEGLRPPLMGMMAGNVWIYENKNGKYVLIGDLDAFENVTPLKSKHYGYMDIQVSLMLNAGKKVEKSKFIFNGSKYELKK